LYGDGSAVLSVTKESERMTGLDFKGLMSESHHCIDCGFNTAPGFPNREEAEQEAARQVAAGSKNWRLPWTISAQTEMYIVHNHVWRAAGMAEGYSGVLCIGCLENRLGRRLIPDDFDKDHPFNTMVGTARLLDRRGHFLDVLGEFPEEALADAELA
jgi:hypothetical protein